MGLIGVVDTIPYILVSPRPIPPNSTTFSSKSHAMDAWRSWGIRRDLDLDLDLFDLDLVLHVLFLFLCHVHHICLCLLLLALVAVVVAVDPHGSAGCCSLVVDLGSSGCQCRLEMNAVDSDGVAGCCSRCHAFVFEIDSFGCCLVVFLIIVFYARSRDVLVYVECKYKFGNIFDGFKI